jgi:hypothetical protein
VQDVLSIIIPLLGAIGILAAIFFALRALSSRFQVSKEAYGVGQLETRRSMQKDLLRAGAALLVGLIFLGAYALISRSDGAAPEPVATPASPEPEVTKPAAGETAVPPATNTPTPAPFPESQVTVLPTIPPAPSPTPIPTATPEPELKTAVVASGVGVYLRQEPSTSAPDIEWLLDGAQLLLLGGEAEADGYVWVLVRTDDGNEGWVAVDFIEIAP